MIFYFMTLFRILRLFGIFPYRWQVKSKKTKTKQTSVHPDDLVDPEDDEEELQYEFYDSLLWKIWSWLLALLLLLCLGWNVYDIFRNSKAKNNGINTLGISYFLYDCIHYITFILTHFYYLRYSFLLKEVVVHAEYFRTGGQIDGNNLWKPSPQILFSLIMYLCLVGLFVVMYIYEGDLFQSYFQFVTYFILLAVHVILIVTVTTVFVCILYLQAKLYEAIFEDFVTLSNSMENAKDGKPLKKLNTVVNNTVTSFLTNDSAEIEELDLAVDGENIDNEKINNTITRCSIATAKENLLHIYSYHRLINKYFASLVVLYVIYLIPVMIISLFYFIIMIEGKIGPMLLLPIFYIILSVGPLFHVLNAPYDIYLMREKTRYRIVRLIHTDQLQHLKKELIGLLRLYDEDIGFAYMGLFTLARGRIVDIVGFVATYVIILVQFKAGEKSSTCTC